MRFPYRAGDARIEDKGTKISTCPSDTTGRATFLPAHGRWERKARVGVAADKTGALLDASTAVWRVISDQRRSQSR